jgi:hypothetical protein
MTNANRHIVDQLADVRAKIKELQDAEKVLKDQVSAAMGSGDSLGGDEFIAWQTISERKGSLDEKALKAAGIDAEKFRKAPVAVVTLRVERRAADVA